MLFSVTMPVNLFPFLCMLSMLLTDSIVNNSLKAVLARKHRAANCEYWIVYGCNPAIFRYQVFVEALSIFGHNYFLRSMDTDMDTVKDTRHMGWWFSKDRIQTLRGNDKNYFIHIYIYIYIWYVYILKQSKLKKTNANYTWSTKSK